MLDFLSIGKRTRKSGSKSITEIYPKFMITKSKDLMIRGGDFYAVYNDATKLWSTDEQDVIRMVDIAIDEFYEAHCDPTDDSIYRLYMHDSDTRMIEKWHRYCQRDMRDWYHMLDEKLIFSNTNIRKEDYASKALTYPLEDAETPAYERLMSVLYSPEERHKIEWAVGSIVSGESKKIQKFIVLYGAVGTGKSTVLNIIQQLFDGYYSVFDARSLGSSANSFALEAFKNNPLVAIQHDGDLSRIEDNTRLNSLVSHELMTVNEKFKSAYSNRFKAFLFMGTNKPVKITDAKSGLLRRLIDVSPSGKKLGPEEYRTIMKTIPFELGGIAQHCKEVYEADKDYYDNYIPTSMMSASNDFYNFVMDKYTEYKKADTVTLRDAWIDYQTYCKDANVPYPLSRMIFKEELKNYFWDFDERLYKDDGSRARSVYSKFRVEKFQSNIIENHEKAAPKYTIEFVDAPSIFDDICADYPAQYGNAEETPMYKWDNVRTSLKDIDTHKLHYVRVPDNMIVIDFDIPDKNGNKCFEKNLEEASKWPQTYSELSKSGAGIHLHYIYNGDASKLSRIYDDHIEIKVFTGNSSLRRKLSKCNNLPIATISSGLPLKGEKMVNQNVIKSERGIRVAIQRNLNKEIHAYTKPSIDFIHKILEDAYNSGLKYDVSDLHNAVLAFAMCSSNQAEYCVKRVWEMHFKSENADEDAGRDSKNITDDDLIFFDCEVFPNLFLINWKQRGKDKHVVRMINPKPEMVEELARYPLVGFNNRRYDNHILYARIQGYSNEQLYKLSQKIITSPKGTRDCFFGEAYNLSYTDIYDFAASYNKKSLKKLEIEMGITHKELGLPWDQPVPEELWTKVAEYCDNDVIATEAAFDYLAEDWQTRKLLADLANGTCNDTTNTLTTKLIFGNDRNPQSQFCYRDISKPVFELDPEVEEFLKEACPEMMSHRHGPENSLLPYFPGYEYKLGVSTYKDFNPKNPDKLYQKVGEGGCVYSEPGMYGDVGLDDIGSQHPHSIIAECLFGPRYTRIFRELVEARIAIKHENWDAAASYLSGKFVPYIQKIKDGKLTSKGVANALKTAINSVYGLTDASFPNAFRDPRNIDNIVAKRGALFMIDLKEEVQKRGYTVAHIKTDSIKIPNADKDILNFVYEFGKRYGYTFEHEATYDRMCLVNKAVYIARYATEEKCNALYGYAPGDNKKHPYQWTPTGDQFAVPYVFKTLFSHESLEFGDYCETFSVDKGALYLDMNEALDDVSGLEAELDKAETKFKKGQLTDLTMADIRADLEPRIAAGHNLHFVGRVGLFCPIKSGNGGGVLYRVDNGKKYAAAGTTGYRWLEAATVKTLNMKECVDERYYISLVDDAVETISKYGDFEMFVSEEPYKRVSEDFMNIPEGVSEDEGIPF